MRVVKYIFALWAGVLLYIMLSVAFGATGLSAYRQLYNEGQKQEANILELKKINGELESTMNSLLYDRDTLTVYAREQGYASAQERFIRIVGLGGTQKANMNTGDIIVALEPQYVSDKTLRMIAFFTALTIFFCMAAFDFMKYLREA